MWLWAWAKHEALLHADRDRLVWKHRGGNQLRGWAWLEQGGQVVLACLGSCKGSQSPFATK